MASVAELEAAVKSADWRAHLDAVLVDERAAKWADRRPVFPTVDDVARAGLRIPATIVPWAGEEGPRWRLTITPGSIQIGTKDYARENRAKERATAARLSDDPAMTDVLERPAPTRGNITSWSQKSRVRMIRRLCSLDYNALTGTGRPPAMVTLTVPGEWKSVAGTPKQFREAVDRFRDRYFKAWGVRLLGVWKLEFQRRGAPHLHILTLPPEGVSRGSRLPFAQWLSLAWAASVDHQDPDQRANHVKAGTAVDYESTLRYADPKRVATYFLKHGMYSAKEYQNEPPREWLEAADGGMRFWGYWQIPVIESIQEIDAALIMHIKRHMRKLQRSNSYVRKESVWRLNSKTGEYRKRKVNRRVRYLRHSGGGFLSVNNGVQAAEDIRRLIEMWWDDGFLRPAPDHAPAGLAVLHRDYDRAAAAEAQELERALREHGALGVVGEGRRAHGLRPRWLRVDGQPGLW